MRYNFTITIQRQDGTIYTCKRVANTEEQAVSAVKVPHGESIIMVDRDWANPNY